jgi:hypothetical protein
MILIKSRALRVPDQNPTFARTSWTSRLCFKQLEEYEFQPYPFRLYFEIHITNWSLEDRGDVRQICWSCEFVGSRHGSPNSCDDNSKNVGLCLDDHHRTSHGLGGWKLCACPTAFFVRSTLNFALGGLVKCWDLNGSREVKARED